MIDSHAHLNDEMLIKKSDEICNQAKLVGVDKIINVGYDLNSSIIAINLAKKYENMYAIVGVHPENVKNYDYELLNEIEILCKNKKVVAIGEIGLDYHFDIESKEIQKEVFIDQIKLAHKLNLPIVVHTRDAINDTLHILQEYKDYTTNGVDIHCFNASQEVLNEVIKRGYFVSFGGAITFKNARGLVDCVKNMPIERIMLETDCPYMSPEPFRGQINTPVNIPIIAKKVAEIKNISEKEVTEVTTNTTKQFFNL